MCAKTYEPKNDELKVVRRRISEARWLERVKDARRREGIVEKILKREKRGESRNSAIAATVGRSKRSATLRDLSNYAAEGFEGLIDRRTPREPEIPISIQDAIEVARMANPSISVEEVRGILEKKYSSSPSSASVKRVWSEAGLSRGVGRPPLREVARVKRPEVLEVEPLAAAGFQLVLAGEAETEAVSRLVDRVMEAGAELPAPSPVSVAERKLRDKKGHLTPRYNRSRRKTRSELIGPAYRTMAEKAEERDPGRLFFRGQKRETVERRLWALVSLPAVTPVKGRIEDLRGPQGRLLEEMCGYAYQSETIRKMVSDLSVAGLGPQLKETHAATWHEVSVERWETDYQAAVVYVDNNVKPLWTGFFAKSTKVSSTGRVQPALSSTFVNTGAGVPIHFETYSGAAPLAPRVLSLLQKVEKQAEQPIGSSNGYRW